MSDSINITLIVVAAVFLIAALIGLWRGFIKSVCSIIAIVAAIILAYIFSPVAVSFVKNHTDVYDKIESFVGVKQLEQNLLSEGFGAVLDELDEEEIKDLGSELTSIDISKVVDGYGEQELLEAIEGISKEDIDKLGSKYGMDVNGLVEDYIGSGDLGEILSGLDANDSDSKFSVESFIESLDEDSFGLPQKVKERINEVVRDGAGSIREKGVGVIRELAENLIDYVIRAIAFAIIFLVSLIIIRLVLNLISHIINDIVLIRSINKILGAVFGMGIAYIIIMIIGLILTYLIPFGVFPSIAEDIANSSILTFLFENNFILKLML